MEKRIQLEKRGRLPSQIQELNLDNCRSTNIDGLTDEFTALETLSLINVGLTTLKGFPKLPNLKKLELSDNRISNGLNYLITSPKLTNLNLSGNKIKNLETLKPLENFQNLEVLDLFNNEATAVENYREKIFAMIPSLKYLDGFDANEVEAPSDGDHDSEDDDVAGGAFCINGLEIDLDELETFEKKLVQKRGAAIKPQLSNEEPDDLDELLEKLKLQDESSSVSDKIKRNDSTESVINNSAILENDIVSHNENARSADLERKQDETAKESDSSQLQPRPVSLPMLMFGLMLIMTLVNYAVFSEEGDEDDEGDDDDDDEDGESDEEDNGDVSLSEVYNEDLEEDNSDWGEENEAEEDDEDGDTDSEADEGDEAAKDENQTEAQVPEESQARGKKRKHEG